MPIITNHEYDELIKVRKQYENQILKEHAKPAVEILMNSAALLFAERMKENRLTSNDISILRNIKDKVPHSYECWLTLLRCPDYTYDNIK